MNNAELEIFKGAVSLAQTGYKAEGHSRLKGLEGANSNDSNLLLWLAFTSGDLTTARFYLDRVSRLDPTNPSLPGAQGWLRSEEAKYPQPTFATASATYPAPNPTSSATYPSYVGAPLSSPQPRQLEPLPSNISFQNSPPAQANTLPDWYRPERDEEGSQRRRDGLLRLVVALVVVLVVVGVIALILSLMGVFGTTAAAPAPDAIAAQGLPVYPATNRLVLTPEDQAKFNKGVNQSISQYTSTDYKLAMEFYTIKPGEKATMQTFYDTELKKLGWTVPSNNTVTKNSVTGKFYLKGQKILLIETIPLTKDDVLEAARYHFDLNDLMMAVMTMEKPGQ